MRRIGLLDDPFIIYSQIDIQFLNLNLCSYIRIEKCDWKAGSKKSNLTGRSAHKFLTG